MTRDAAAELLDLIIDRAPRLLESGIRGRVSIAGVVSFDLAGHDPEADESTPDQAQEPGDPLLDPATYGRPPGSSVPGDTRAKS
jgi:hypothetical protein